MKTAGHGNKKILIVDDNPDVTKVLALQLKGTGFLIDEVQSGEAALEMVRDDSFIKICIVDVNMPKMNGLQFIMQLRKIRKNVEVILISGIKDKKIIAKGLQIGAKNYLLKPIKKEDLIAAVWASLAKVPVEMNELIFINQIPLEIDFTLTKICENEIIFHSDVPFKVGGNIKIASPNIEKKYDVVFNLNANITDCSPIGEGEFCVIGKITSPIEFVTPLVTSLRNTERKAA